MNPENKGSCAELIEKLALFKYFYKVIKKDMSSLVSLIGPGRWVGRLH